VVVSVKKGAGRCNLLPGNLSDVSCSFEGPIT
jgi:hypothetical protein